MRAYVYWCKLLPIRVSLVAQMVKNLSAMQETWVQSLGLEDPLEKGIVNHSTILAWRILCTEELGRLQSIGSQRVRHDWATNIYTLPIIPFLHINNLGNIFYTFLPGYGRVCVFFFSPSRITIIILLKYQNLINSLILYQVPTTRHRPGNMGTQINES